MNPNTPQPIRAKYTNQMKMLRGFYEAIPEIGVQVRDFGAKRVADATGAGAQFRDHTNLLIDLGVIKREGPEYGTPANGMTVGRHYHYTLLMPLTEALLRLEDWQNEDSERAVEIRAGAAKKAGETRRANGAIKPETPKATPIVKEVSHMDTDLDLDAIEAEIRNAGSPAAVAALKPARTSAQKFTAPTAVAPPVEDEVVAIAGDDAPAGLAASVKPETITRLRAMRKDESGALVTAARQYLARAEIVGKMLDELKTKAAAAGITFDAATATSLFEMQEDTVLETVALTIPYIDSQLRIIAALERQLDAQHEKVADYDRMERDYKAMKRSNERHIAASVAASTASTH
jgi:hypothetical protein